MKINYLKKKKKKNKKKQPGDILHVDLFNSIYQKSYNVNMRSPKDTDLTLFLDDK